MASVIIVLGAPHYSLVLDTKTNFVRGTYALGGSVSVYGYFGGSERVSVQLPLVGELGLLHLDLLRRGMPIRLL